MKGERGEPRNQATCQWWSTSPLVTTLVVAVLFFWLSLVLKCIHMADTTVRILFCLLDGETTFFHVKVNTNDMVIRLKQVIHKEKSVAFQGVADANQMILLKVSSIYPNWFPQLNHSIVGKRSTAPTRQRSSSSGRWAGCVGFCAIEGGWY